MLLYTPLDKRSKGAIVTEEMLGIKRPGTGIEPKYIDRVVGGVASVLIRQD